MIRSTISILQTSANCSIYNIFMYIYVIYVYVRSQQIVSIISYWQECKFQCNDAMWKLYDKQENCFLFHLIVAFVIIKHSLF